MTGTCSYAPAVAWAADLLFLRELLVSGTVHTSVLEIGSYNRQGGHLGNGRHTCHQAGVRWEGADIVPGPDVDLLLDVLDDDAVGGVGRRWPCVLLLNLLEHVYDPPLALRNARRLVEPGGVIAVAGPVIWEAHDYPHDYWRPMPGFFLEFARREGLDVVPGSPTWLLEDRLLPFDALRDGSQHLVPSRRFAPQVNAHRPRSLGALLDRGVARLAGRRWVFPFCGFGVALRLPPQRPSA